MEDWGWIRDLPEGSPERAEAERLAGELIELREADPLQFFYPHRCRACGEYVNTACMEHATPQLDFFRARTRIVAAFAGNGFGKSSALVGRALIEVADREHLPERLRAFKSFDAPAHGWILCPTEEKVFDSLQPAFEKWTPKHLFHRGAWGKAFNGERMRLTFSNGSSIGFKTYKQDASTLGGAEIDFVGYDEPPPKAHRSECLARLRSTPNAYEMYAMTPIRANTGWLKRDIWRQRESPDITVIRGSIHDNPTLDPATKEFILSQFPEIERKAREHGDFMDFGGLMYPEFEGCVLGEHHPRIVRRGGELMLDPEFVRSLVDVLVGIDPGIRNAGFSFAGFDRDLVEWVFDEGLLQDKVPRDYAQFIRATLERWGIAEERVEFVIDPAARQRGQTNAQTVLAALENEGVHATPGQNDHEAGFGQMRARMRYGRYWVSPACRLMRAEADDYAAKEPEDGKDDSHLDPVPGGAHILDANRYLTMERFWDFVAEEQAPQRNLGWRPGEAPSARDLSAAIQPAAHPLGSMV